MRPRFTVGSVTGWPISEASLSERHRPKPEPSTLWYVLDSAYGYGIVREYRSHNGHAGPEQLARALCERLNEKAP